MVNHIIHMVTCSTIEVLARLCYRPARLISSCGYPLARLTLCPDPTLCSCSDAVCCTIIPAVPAPRAPCGSVLSMLFRNAQLGALRLLSPTRRLTYPRRCPDNWWGMAAQNNFGNSKHGVDVRMTPVSASTPRDLAALFICRLATCSRSKPTEIKGNSPNKAEARTVDAVVRRWTPRRCGGAGLGLPGK
jgi:hypothetical protein